jgi:hypothetical protein
VELWQKGLAFHECGGVTFFTKGIGILALPERASIPFFVRKTKAVPGNSNPGQSGRCRGPGVKDQVQIVSRPRGKEC